MNSWKKLLLHNKVHLPNFDLKKLLFQGYAINVFLNNIVCIYFLINPKTYLLILLTFWQYYKEFLTFEYVSGQGWPQLLKKPNDRKNRGLKLPHIFYGGYFPLQHSHLWKREVREREKWPYFCSGEGFFPSSAIITLGFYDNWKSFLCTNTTIVTSKKGRTKAPVSVLVPLKNSRRRLHRVSWTWCVCACEESSNPIPMGAICLL